MYEWGISTPAEGLACCYAYREERNRRTPRRTCTVCRAPLTNRAARYCKPRVQAASLSKKETLLLILIPFPSSFRASAPKPRLRPLGLLGIPGLAHPWTEMFEVKCGTSLPSSSATTAYVAPRNFESFAPVSAPLPALRLRWTDECRRFACFAGPFLVGRVPMRGVGECLLSKIGESRRRN